MDLAGAALLVPRAGLAVAGSLRRRAVRNARASAAGLSEQAGMRRVLAPAPAGAPVQPGGLATLSPGDCWELIGAAGFGRLAYIARAGVPDVVPVNYAVVDGEVLLRSGPGPKLQAADRRETVAFEVDRLDEATRSGWSVVVTGQVARLSVREVRALDEALLPRPWASGPRTEVIRIRPTRVSGRRLA